MPRVTIRRLMAAIAALDRPSLGILAFVLLASILWLPPVIITSWFGELLGGGRAHASALAILFVVVLGLWLMGPYRVDGAFDASMAAVVLTVANGVGPFYAADRFRRGLPLTSGHLLWAWAGLVWPAQFFLAHPHSRGSYQEAMAGSTRLLPAAVVLLLAFGKRPVGKDRAHHAGWLVVECNMIAWSWCAALTLRWI